MSEEIKEVLTPDSKKDFQCHLYALSVREGGVVEFEGAAFTTLQGWKSRIVGLRVFRPGSQAKEIDVQRFSDHRANVIAKDKKVDQSYSHFYGRFDSRSLIDTNQSGSFDQEWKIQVVLESYRGSLRSTNHVEFSSWEKGGTAQFNRAQYIDSNVLVQVKWVDGLALNLAKKAVMAESFAIEGTQIKFKLNIEEFRAISVCLFSGEEVFSESRLQSEGSGGFTGVLDLNTLPSSHNENVYFVVKDARGKKRFVHYAPDSGLLMHRVSAYLGRYLSRTPRSLLRIDRAERFVTVDSLAVSGPATLQAHGWSDLPLKDIRIRLVSNRSESAAVALNQLDSGYFSAHIPLATSGTNLPLAPGSYKLEVRGGSTPSSYFAQVGTDLFAGLGTLRGTRFVDVAANVGRNGDLVLKIRSTLSDFERSEYGRNVNRRISHALKTDEGTALFEVFNGRSSGDNPRALFEELHRRRPDIQICWAVADLSVPVPSGTEPVVIHSSEYYRKVNSSEFLITNNWLPPQSIARESQRILQTWHGTPLKTLGLDRFHSGSDRQRMRMREMTSLWDGLISQNPYSSEIFRECYAYEGRVLETGYPRNDILVNGVTDESLRMVRERLGISREQKVLLYMPTWREDDKSIFNELDLNLLKRQLGDEWVVLVRGHAMNAKKRIATSIDGVIDVSLVNDPAVLYLLADVMVTDYSSSMFDFTITGKPVAFFVPDYQRYRDELRGMYFDLLECAPGPLVATTVDLIEFVEGLPSSARAYGKKYDAWRAQFNPWDDGRATERVVDFLLDRTNRTPIR